MLILEPCNNLLRILIEFQQLLSPWPRPSWHLPPKAIDEWVICPKQNEDCMTEYAHLLQFPHESIKPDTESLRHLAFE